MEKDAVSAGVSKVGGLFSTAEVRILICYILSSIGEPVPGQTLANVLHYEGIANCFEVNDSIASLCKSGQLKAVDEAEDTYIITDSGKAVSDTLSSSLSLAVRDRAYAAALKMVSLFKNAKETDIKISKEYNKTFITCSAIDNKIPFISVKMLIADDEQGEFIKNRFLDDPSGIYSKIIELLTK